jgi:putative membrane-bound dehydrogenase-like protein
MNELWVQRICPTSPKRKRGKTILGRLRFGLVIMTLLCPSYLPAGGLTPEEAVQRMKVPDGFEVRLVASEPLIVQPVSMSFDDRGRLWVLQYIQYPTPAGLKPIAVDQFLRTKYDRLPEPPPRGPKGADKLTILFDPDERGRFRQAKDFVTGLNLASGFCIGRGGVYIVQPPYLLFYPDRNRDDVPDGDPEVLLTGFGQEDAHAYANSLQWGPDGWLYGTQGSTVTANIRGIEFQQGIWRYHPVTKEFELFSEGGGNTWGLDFDRHGNAIAGTNFGGNAMLHQVQGGYYIKNFGKHGALHNPHTYGYFDHVPYRGFQGGHVTCGGVLYRGGAFPESFNDVYIAGNLLSNVVNWHVIERKGSSFTARHGGTLLTANDSWFRPIDCLVGPDGALYVADWYDQRANHVDPVDTWDRTNGRVYKVLQKGASSASAFDLSKLMTAQLIDRLADRNDWQVNEARRILAERRDEAAIPRLEAIAARPGRESLEALWTLIATSQLNDASADRLLSHHSEDVRAWILRWFGDRRRVTSLQRERLIELARTDPSPVVRSQLASTCQRLPCSDALPVVHALFGRSEDVSDPHIPLQLWWAVERHALEGRQIIAEWFGSSQWWAQPLVRELLLERIGRRYLAEGENDLRACARLLDQAPGAAEREAVIRGMEQALVGRRLDRVPAELESPLARIERESPSLALLRLKVRLGDVTAYERLLRAAADAKTRDADRAALVETLGQVGTVDCVPTLLGVLASTRSESVRAATLTALQTFDAPQVPSALIDLYAKATSATRARIQNVLVSRPNFALAMLKAVDAGRIPPKDVPLDMLRRMAAHKHDAIDKLLAKHWGRIAPEPAGEKIARIRNLFARIKEAPGDIAKGKEIFKTTCAPCHTLFNDGGKTGPELTGFDRKNTQFLLTHVIDPSAVIRPEYIAYDVVTTDGRTLFGLIADPTPTAVTLIDVKNERTLLPRSKIESMEPSAVSLMPEKLLDQFTDQQIRDLFAYLQSDQPPPATKSPN